MSTNNPPSIGTIAWTDLTVPNAAEVRDFYAAVVGWTAAPVAMGGYDDYCMNRPDTDDTVAGICHARGSNANVPPQWLIYILVPDVAAAAKMCTERGGTVVDGPRSAGGKQFCIIRDPAGAVAGLIEP